MQIDHINIKAPAALLEQVREFYCAVLGLDEGPRPDFPSPGYWLYARECPLVHLSVGPETTARPAAGYLDHVAFRAEDLVTFLARLDSIGYRLSVQPHPRTGPNPVVPARSRRQRAGNQLCRRGHALSRTARSRTSCLTRFPLSRRYNDLRKGNIRFVSGEGTRDLSLERMRRREFLADQAPVCHCPRLLGLAGARRDGLRPGAGRPVCHPRGRQHRGAVAGRQHRVRGASDSA